ncbi:MAG: hypothetical protein HY548_06290 [Elusimicrobia bacterium]|nr:hypothetical protein [Elusimicrobiota bacterium]
MIETVGMIAAIGLPFFNIPLIIKIQKRRSSKDISLSWTFGVLSCLFLMLPSGLASADPVFKVFSVVNVLFFTGVAVQVMRFRKGDEPPAPPPSPQSSEDSRRPSMPQGIVPVSRTGEGPTTPPPGARG